MLLIRNRSAFAQPAEHVPLLHGKPGLLKVMMDCD